MVSWQTFSEQAPELAQLAMERFRATELVMLGTLRTNGWPRISPAEFMIFEGDFLIGMMWQSKKAVDLLRDGRCTIHSATSNKSGQEGDAKLYVVARPLDEERLEAAWRQVEINTGWRPQGPAHAFTFDIRAASFVRFTGDGTMHWLAWPGPAEWRSQRSS